MNVARRVDVVRRRRGGGLADDAGGGYVSDEGGRCLLGQEWPFPKPEQRDASGGAPARLVERDRGGDASKGEVAAPARHLVEGIAGPRRGRRDRHLGEQLARLERRREQPGEKISGG